jgi:hypothetical protein
MRNVSRSMRDTLRGVALVGMGLLTVPSLMRVPSAVVACGVSGAADTARGHVFEDTNGNSVRDAGEPGLAGVPVSNGCEVTLTDEGGAYAVPVAPGQILFITKPSRYAVPVDEHNVAQFFYRHYPGGTAATVEGAPVAWRFPVVEATGPLPAAVDFALYPLEEASDRFSAYGFADPQARLDLSQDMLREDLVNTLMGNPYGVQFGLTMGDVANDNLDIYDRHKRMMGLLDVPQWSLPGNHDVNYESPDARLANETYKRHFGPTYYSFDHGNVHFVALNNVEYAGAGAEGRNGGYRGYISSDQLFWLERDLAVVPRERLIVIATHIPLVAEASDGRSPMATGPSTENLAPLLELLEPFEHIYGLAGHDTSNSWKVAVNHTHGWYGQPWVAHTMAEVRGNGWTTGPADPRGVRDAMMEDGNPNGFYVLRFDDVELTPEFIPFPYGPDAGQRMRISLDPLLVAPEGGGVNRGTPEPGTKVVVNLFDGGPRDSVWFSLNGATLQAMTYTVRTDPHVDRLHARYAGTDDAYGRPHRSSHIWEYPLPDRLGPGLYRLEVTSEDEFGQRRLGRFSFEVSGG